VLGALTIQSERAQAFDEVTLIILQTMADLVGVSIDNARLYVRNRASLEEARSANRELSRRSWEAVLQAGQAAAVQVQQSTVSPSVDLPEMEIPIQVRGEIIGSLAAHKGAGQTWRPEEVALLSELTSQLGAALETARLFEETQRRAERERIAGEITARVRASNDPQVILQTAVSELRRALGAGRVQAVVAEARQPDGAAPEPFSPANHAPTEIEPERV
jgi:GAF domain-containing protein